MRRCSLLPRDECRENHETAITSSAMISRLRVVHRVHNSWRSEASGDSPLRT